MKKTIIGIVILLIANTFAFAQQDAWVYLTDKQDVSFALDNPLTILTQRALNRKAAHSIAIDERDVPVNENYISQLKSETGITVLAKSKWFNAVHVRGSEADINSLLALNFVDYIDFADKSLNTSSRVLSPQSKFEIEDTQVEFVYGDTMNQVEMIGADELHLQDFTGEGIIIAVLDAGFTNVNTMSAFQRLRDNNDLLDGYDFVDRSTDIYAFTENDHGTKVLSDMAGFVQDEFVGTSPDASFYLFRTEDIFSENPVEESYWVEAAERADSLGVNIINTSLGYKTYENPNYSYIDSDLDGNTTFSTRGANIASEKGILVINSAGNSGESGVAAPADGINVLSIGAVDMDGLYVAFSSQGSTNQPTQKPDVVARGAGTYVIGADNVIVQNNGTSFSSPIMTGGAACLMQALPNASVEQLKQFIRESASQFNTPDSLLGFGIPDLQLALDIGLSVLENEVETFQLYPNPVATKLNVIFPQGLEQAELYIFDVLGKLVVEKILFNQFSQIDMTSMSPGIYMLRIKSSTISKTFKLIKS